MDKSKVRLPSYPFTTRPESVRCLIDITQPGRSREHIPWLTSMLARYGISFKEVDTVMGYGNLNQDWIEFECEVETSWGWCKPTFLDLRDWGALVDALEHGRLIMMAYYVTQDDPHGERKFIPHH